MNCAASDMLLAIAKRLLEDHQRIEPHHADLCELCISSKRAIADAEDSI